MARPRRDRGATAPASLQPAIVLRNLCRAFGAREVLRDVALVRDAPGIVGLTGPNGCGKTTLLRLLAQLLEPDAGTITICGRAVERADNAAVRALVGWVPSTPLAWLDDDVATNLRYAARLAGVRRPLAAPLAAAAVERWDLAGVAGQSVRHLSRGWQQRYALARADLLSPPILLLDEPTIGLDTAAREHLDAALDGWRSDRIVVVASHEHEWLTATADDVIALAVGP